MWPILSYVKVISNLREGMMEEDQGTGTDLIWASKFWWFGVALHKVCHFCLIVCLMRAARSRMDGKTSG